MNTTAGLTLADGLDLAGISYNELWTRYLAIGGAGNLTDLRRRVQASETVSDLEHDVIAQAINEFFLDRGQDHPVGYWRPVAVEPGTSPDT